MRNAEFSALVLVVLNAACTDDPRPSATRSQINTALSTCGVNNATIADGIADVTSDLVVNFNSNTGEAARHCFERQMEHMNVLQTTGWSGPSNA